MITEKYFEKLKFMNMLDLLGAGTTRGTACYSSYSKYIQYRIFVTMALALTK